MAKMIYPENLNINYYTSPETCAENFRMFDFKTLMHMEHFKICILYKGWIESSSNTAIIQRINKLGDW